MDTDQGGQVTSRDSIKTLKDVDMQICMEGRGMWRDNIFVGRLRRTIKFEEVYLRACDSLSAARDKLRQYLAFYSVKERTDRGIGGHPIKHISTRRDQSR